MNRQVHYIISAFLLLLLLAGAYFLIPKFSFTSSDKASKKHFIPKTSTSVSLTDNAVKGKILFMAKCASCHQINKNSTGPGLIGFEERGPWVERKNVYEWIRNPAAFIAKNEYARELKEVYGGIVMTAFSDMTNEEIDAICDYISQAEKIRSLPIAER